MVNEDKQINGVGAKPIYNKYLIRIKCFIIASLDKIIKEQSRGRNSNYSVRLAKIIWSIEILNWIIRAVITKVKLIIKWNVRYLIIRWEKIKIKFGGVELIEATYILLMLVKINRWFIT